VLRFTSVPTNTSVSTNSSVTLQGTGNGEIVHGLPFVFANLNKAGAGTWTLGGSIGNTGATTVNAGTFIMNGNQPSATGAFAVNGTSTLGGSGTVSGAVTVAVGASLAPGAPASVGTLTLRSSLNLSAPANGGAGKLRFDLGPIAASDRIAVGGTLTIGTDVLGFGDFAFTLPGGLQNGTYKLITSGAPISGTLDPDPANLTGTLGAGPATGTLQIRGSGTDLELVVSGVIGGLSGYGLWSSTNAPSGTPDSDFEGDGVSNAVEFVLGGDKNTNDIGKLPVTTPRGTDLRFTFVRSQASNGSGPATQIETGTLLTAWPDVFAVGATTPGSTPGVTVAKDTPAVGQDTITLTLPRGIDARKFARLKVTLTP
jgi:autotransporter-associated beta strand protein